MAADLESCVGITFVHPDGRVEGGLFPPEYYKYPPAEELFGGTWEDGLQAIEEFDWSEQLSDYYGGTWDDGLQAIKDISWAQDHQNGRDGPIDRDSNTSLLKTARLQQTELEGSLLDARETELKPVGVGSIPDNTDFEMQIEDESVGKAEVGHTVEEELNPRRIERAAVQPEILADVLTKSSPSRIPSPSHIVSEKQGLVKPWPATHTHSPTSLRANGDSKAHKGALEVPIDNVAGVSDGGVTPEVMPLVQALSAQCGPHSETSESGPPQTNSHDNINTMDVETEDATTSIASIAIRDDTERGKCALDFTEATLQNILQEGTSRNKVGTVNQSSFTQSLALGCLQASMDPPVEPATLLSTSTILKLPEIFEMLLAANASADAASPGSLDSPTGGSEGMESSVPAAAVRTDVPEGTRFPVAPQHTLQLISFQSPVPEASTIAANATPPEEELLVEPLLPDLEVAAATAQSQTGSASGVDDVRPTTEDSDRSLQTGSSPWAGALLEQELARRLPPSPFVTPPVEQDTAESKVKDNNTVSQDALGIESGLSDVRLQLPPEEMLVEARTPDVTATNSATNTPAAPSLQQSGVARIQGPNRGLKAPAPAADPETPVVETSNQKKRSKLAIRKVCAERRGSDKDSSLNASSESDEGAPVKKKQKKIAVSKALSAKPSAAKAGRGKRAAESTQCPTKPARKPQQKYENSTSEKEEGMVVSEIDELGNHGTAAQTPEHEISNIAMEEGKQQIDDEDMPTLPLGMQHPTGSPRSAYLSPALATPATTIEVRAPTPTQQPTATLKTPPSKQDKKHPDCHSFDMGHSKRHTRSDTQSEAACSNSSVRAPSAPPTPHPLSAKFRAAAPKVPETPAKVPRVDVLVPKTRGKAKAIQSPGDEKTGTGGRVTRGQASEGSSSSVPTERNKFGFKVHTTRVRTKSGKGVASSSLSPPPPPPPPPPSPAPPRPKRGSGRSLAADSALAPPDGTTAQSPASTARKTRRTSAAKSAVPSGASGPTTAASTPEPTAAPPKHNTRRASAVQEELGKEAKKQSNIGLRLRSGAGKK